MFIGTTRSRGIFHSEAVHPDSVSSFCSYTRKEAVSSVKKTSATPKKARTDRHSRWSKKELCNKTKPHWRPPAGREVGQCSHGKWRSSKLQGKWKEISVEIDAAIDERQEHKERSMLKDKLKQLQKERRRKRLVGNLKRCNAISMTRASETERRLGRVLGEYIYSFEKEMGCPHWTLRK